MTLAIIILSITNILSIALVLFMRHRWAQVAAYARKSDQDRVALAIEVGELKEERNYISFAPFDAAARQN